MADVSWVRVKYFRFTGRFCSTGMVKKIIHLKSGHVN